MDIIKDFAYKNVGTLESPEWKKYLVKTLADCILMSDELNSQTLLEFLSENIGEITEKISNEINARSTAIDSLEEQVSQKVERTYVEEQIGNIETALDEIIAIQNTLIGGTE